MQGLEDEESWVQSLFKIMHSLIFSVCFGAFNFDERLNNVRKFGFSKVGFVSFTLECLFLVCASLGLGS